ncbi:uncharacterized protein EV420DRAFT_1769035 [Desarmillaria tabescens]|uniref:CxC1-like cysteine cluster associated with KDZ transposases domain-containing protein n=1 Tax=Armillaria tabescens TaxID=1929756 RepID=A0AA39MNF8_ARMTA|nr:uncharacterized protein EV420DRAFT_1769035 [Desarmillaria tabescens]KAK0441211.1 hypothetical protein EV420DRAFT_1769035 [Desarmillaria tabescens]
MGLHRASGSSSKIRLPVSIRGNRTKSVLHSCKAVEKRARAAKAAEKEHLKNLTPEQLAEIQSQKIQLSAASDHPEDDEDYDSNSWQDIEDVARMNGILRGDETMEISHEGREFELARDLREKLTEKWKKRQRCVRSEHPPFYTQYPHNRRRRDVHKRCNRTQQRIDAFKMLLEPMTDAYMDWVLVRDADKSPLAEEGGQSSDGIWVIDIFRRFCMPNSNLSIGSLVRNGIIPCAPKRPGLVVTFRVMEIFHTAILRCPQLSIQDFIRTLCNLHSFPIASSLKEQFSICYDVFIAILENVERQVLRELGRSHPDWQLKNCCAACTFELEGEEQLEFSMFGAMDGNDSLKRIPRSKVVDTLEGNRVSIERDDLRDGGGGYILPRTEVDRWSKEAIGDVEAVDMGVFEETGFFLSLCRHGSVLLGADMVKSGEQAKYPLAIVGRLLEVFGDRLGIGYDIGCKFGSTINQSPLGELAKIKRFRVLVSKIKSNGLARGIRYASRFHRCQRITWYLKHVDRLDSFEHLSSFLCNNYRQALDIIDDYPALQKSMQELGVTDEKEFEAWLSEEEAYLSGLQREPPEETIEMEYYTRLIHYYDVESKVAASRRVVFVNTTTDTQPQPPDDTRKMETARRHLLERRSQELERVQDLECSLNISPEDRWIVGSEKWRENEQRVAMRTYRRCLDRLEGLIVARIFELTKMNMSHTGYKMRKHIGKALKARSQAIRTALTQYNVAAATLIPPRPLLKWERVVEYAFLADFDLLRDVRKDMSERK